MVARYAALGPWRTVEKRSRDRAAHDGRPVDHPAAAAARSMRRRARFLDAHIPESVAPLIVVAPLFWLAEERGSVRPILELDDLAAIDWPVIVLFAGGMCLGQLMMQTGVAKALGELLAALRAERATARCWS